MSVVWHSFVTWFASVINLMYGFTVQMGLPSYGLAIILMTIAIKLVLFPLTQKQMKSMSAMQKIQPKTKYIQEKYKDDPQLMQQKIMEMYKEHGVSPFGGCLPLLIQMPIFIAFYQSLFNFKFVNKAHAGFLWIPNIGNPDPYFILAILAAATTFLQQKVSMVESNDPTQKTMLYFMPVFMAYIAYKMPAGLPLYWVVFNILGIMQQLYVNHGNRILETSSATAVQVEIEEKTKPSLNQEKKSKTKDAGRDKGGKDKNAEPNNRKKGKSVDEAIKAALEEMGCDIDAVKVEVVEEGSKGLLGFIGTKQAVVRVTLKLTPEAQARQVVDEILTKMKIDYEINKVEFNQGTVRINIVGNDMGLLIGRKGETLNALQFIAGLIINRQQEERIRLILDVEDYRKKREESLESLALRLSDKVKNTQKNVVMRPMSSQERRIVHTILQEDSQVVTYSMGDEPNRKVVIALKK